MQTAFFPAILYIGLALAVSAANVGVVDANDERSDLDVLLEIIQGLGHKAEKLPEQDLLRPTGLNHYDCIILAHRSGELAESGYKALDEYVKEGGTLLLTGTAAYWMKTTNGPQPRIRIAGAGPLKETAGIKIIGFREAPIKRLIVVAKAPATAGLPESFVLQTTPAYDITNPATWRHAGAFNIQAESATPLINAEMVTPEGQTVTGAFLTVKQHGQGQCYRLALCRMVPMVFEKKEQTISRILQNMFKSAEQVGRWESKP